MGLAIDAIACWSVVGRSAIDRTESTRCPFVSPWSPALHYQDSAPGRFGTVGTTVRVAFTETIRRLGVGWWGWISRLGARTVAETVGKTVAASGFRMVRP
jgi:hypothetical protein